MTDLDNLRGKIIELKRKRDDYSSAVSSDRSVMTSLDEQISDLERQKAKIKMAVDEKESQVRKLDELIRQSESAVQKMISNTQKLNDALQQALEDNI